MAIFWCCYFYTLGKTLNSYGFHSQVSTQTPLEWCNFLDQVDIIFVQLLQSFSKPYKIRFVRFAICYC